MKVLKKLNFLLFFLTITLIQSQSSVQDCVGAIPVCQNVYVQNSSFSGVGNIPNEITSGCLADGEINDVWYILQVSSSGFLNFIISPSNPSDDYDWGVYNLTNKDCNNVNDPGVLVSCNYSGTPGVTGPNGNTTQTSAGEFDSPYNNTIAVTQGETYLINISNWSSTNDGYVLNFSNSTASIADNDAPELTSLEGDFCGSNSLLLEFSERIKCNSLLSSDFSLVGPSGTIPFAFTSDCSSSSFTESVELLVNSSLQETGNYTLTYIGGATDNCDNNLLPFSVDFSISNLSIQSTITNSLCTSNTGSIILNVLNGSPGYNYYWSNGLSNQNSHFNLGAGEYQVTITDSQGCEKTVNYNVEYLIPVEAFWSDYNIPSCNGFSNGSLEVAPSSGTAPFTYLWNQGGTTNKLSGIQTGLYSVTIESADGCSITMDTLLVEPDPVALSISFPDLVCVNQTEEITFNLSGGTPSYQVDWGFGFTSVLNSFLSVSSDTLISAIGRDSNGCASQQTNLNVQVSTNINVLESFDTTLCQGDKFGFSVQASGGNTGPYTYYWNTSSSNSPLFLIDSVYEQTIKVYARDACNSPSDTATINIDISQKPLFNYLALDSGQCSPLETQLIPIHLEPYPLSFEWYSDNQLLSSDSLASVSLITPGCYNINLIVTDSNNCEFNIEKNCFLEVYPLPNTNFSHNPDTAIFLNPSYTFFNITENSISQNWDFGDGSYSTSLNPFHTYSDTGRYNVKLTVENIYGCSNSINRDEIVEFLTLLYFPSAFTPNQDGKNDYFYIQSNGLNYDEFEITIYDRWGHLVFESKAVEFKWDGTFLNKELPLGVYQYRIKATDFKDDIIDQLGSVTLIR